MTTEAVPVLPTGEDRIRAALWFAEHGFGVFTCWSAREDGTCRCPAGASCDSPGKHPITVNGFKDATRDPARIRTLLEAGSHPNYGVVCPPGVFTWDVDGEDLLRLAELGARLGPLPATLETLTANGRHLFFRWPEAYARPLHKQFGFVTRWGSEPLAGYVVGPRSIHHSGAVYTPTGVADIATLPDAWAQAVLDDQARPTIKVTGRPDHEQVRVGGRHDWLRDTARYYAGVVRDPDALFAAIWAENQKLAEPKTEAAVHRAIGEVLAKYGPDPVEEDPDTGAVRRVSPDDEPGMLVPAAAGEFPQTPEAAAFEGLLGECAMALAPGTDASLVGLLGSVLAFAGALVPGSAYQYRLQTSSPFIALVGDSSVGRKGTAMWRAHDAMSDALEAVYVNRVLLDGLNSGEGLITTLAYKQATFPYEPTVGLVFEEEYASLLASRGRDGSTLDPKMRAGFDGGPLSNRKSAGTQTVTPPYWLPALIAITPHELRKRLESDALQSGSANRWLYLPVVKRATVPDGSPPRFPVEHRDALAAARRWAMDRRPLLAVQPGVTSTLSDYAEFLPGVATGTARDLTKRLPVIAFRIALIHALAERASAVAVDHLARAIALTEYARAGIDWVFGGTVGNRDADLLLRHLQKSEHLTRRQAERIVRDSLRRQDAIDELVRLGYANVVTVHETRGRPRDELRLARSGGTSSRFSHVPDMRPTPDTPNRGTNGTNSTDGVGETRDEGGTKSGRSAPDERLVDRETGEVVSTGEAIWALPCTDYTDHQDHHRNGPNGWYCNACRRTDAPPDAPTGICPVCTVGPFIAAELYERHWWKEHRP